jgi:hypothetical protein
MNANEENQDNNNHNKINEEEINEEILREHIPMISVDQVISTWQYLVGDPVYSVRQVPVPVVPIGVAVQLA